MTGFVRITKKSEALREAIDTRLVPDDKLEHGTIFICIAVQDTVGPTKLYRDIRDDIMADIKMHDPNAETFFEALIKLPNAYYAVQQCQQLRFMYADFLAHYYETDVETFGELE